MDGACKNVAAAVPAMSVTRHSGGVVTGRDPLDPAGMSRRAQPAAWQAVLAEGIAWTANATCCAADWILACAVVVSPAR